jgi:CBS domain-containing protein
MWWRQMGALAVVDGERLVGCLGEDDLLRVAVERLEAAKDAVEEEGGDLLVWESLLGGLRVADAMTPRGELTVAPPGTTLLEGLHQAFRSSPGPTSSRYLFVLDEREALARVVSIRDVARYLIALDDGSFDAFADAAAGARARRTASAVLDLSIGALRERLALGHAPPSLAIDEPGDATLRRMWQGGRGYAIATEADGIPVGICTRRDALRALRHPFLRLDGLRVARIMTRDLRSASAGETLGGLFKSMAIEGCRHMPILDEADRVACVISMWEAVALLAEGGVRHG